MQDNDFEKQVHKKMGELQLHPSEAVWEQVEIRLHRKEKRRWLLWLPLLVAGLFVGGYFFLTTGRAGSSHSISATIPRPAEGRHRHASPGSNATIAKSLADSLVKASYKPGAAKSPVNLIPVDRVKANSSNVTIAVIMKSLPALLYAKKYHPPVTAGSSVDKAGNPSPVVKSGASSYNRRANPASKPGFEDHRKEKATIEFARQTVLQPSVPVMDKTISPDQQHNRQLSPGKLQIIPFDHSPVTISATTSGHITPRAIAIKKRVSKQWEWGLTFAGGRSSLNSGTIGKGFFGANYDAQSSAAPSNGIGAPANPVHNELYPVRAATGFSAGIIIKKKLSEKVWLVTGLNYNLFTNLQAMGNRVDSIINFSNSFNSARQYNQYYRSTGAINDYRIRYHFIELPVLLQLQLMQNRSIPLNWDFGFSVSQLVATNALHFDSSTGYYYQNNDFFQKTQLNILTGFPATVITGKAFRLQAGPALKYGLTNTLTDNNTSAKRFLFLGLKANLLFNKK